MISSTTRKTSIFLGNGVTAVYPFSFKIMQAADLQVIQSDLTGLETTLSIGTNYTVSLNADQDVAAGGSITLLVALPLNFKLVITSNAANLQPTKVTNTGGFQPAIINSALDRLTIFCQQLGEKLGRSVTFPITANVTAAFPAPVINTVIGWNNTGDGFINRDIDTLVNTAVGSAIANDGYVGYQDTNSGVVATVKKSIIAHNGFLGGYIHVDGDTKFSVLSGSSLNSNNKFIRSGLIGFRLNDNTAGAEKGYIDIFTKTAAGGQAVAMRIDDTQRVQINKAVNNYNAQLEVDAGNARNGVSIDNANNPLVVRQATAGGFLAQFLNNAVGEIGSIKNIGNTSTLYSTTSDERLKKDFIPIVNVGKMIDAIGVYNFKWKSNDTNDVGVKAQELHTVYPEAVTVGDENSPWQVDYSKIVPLLLAEIKELRTRVQNLEGVYVINKA